MFYHIILRRKYPFILMTIAALALGVTVQPVSAEPVQAPSAATKIKDLDREALELEKAEQSLLSQMSLETKKTRQNKSAAPVAAKSQAAPKKAEVAVSAPGKTDAQIAPAVDIQKAADAVSRDTTTVAAVVTSSATSAPKIETKVVNVDANASELIAQLKKQADITRLVQDEEHRLGAELKALGKDLITWKKEVQDTRTSLMRTQKDVISTKQSILETQKNSAEQDAQLERRIASLDQAYSERMVKLEAANSSLHGRDSQYETSLKELQAEYDQIKVAMQAQGSSIESLKMNDTQLKQRATEGETGIKQITADVTGMNERLVALQTGLEKLSTRVSENIKRQPHAVYPVRQQVWNSGSITYGQDGPRYSYIPHSAVTQDMQIATVSVDDAELWSGPEEHDKVLDRSPRGSRLAVEALQDEWYRVIAPDGTRAWIQSRNVVFSDSDRFAMMNLGAAASEE